MVEGKGRGGDPTAAEEEEGGGGGLGARGRGRMRACWGDPRAADWGFWPFCRLINQRIGRKINDLLLFYFPYILLYSFSSLTPGKIYKRGVKLTITVNNSFTAIKPHIFREE